MPTSRHLEIRPRLPARLEVLSALAGNLYYSWSRPVRDLFDSIDSEVWLACEENPVRFLQTVPQAQLDAKTEDAAFLAKLDAVMRDFEAYLGQVPDTKTEDGAIAYLCAEFGFHESLPIYSGGLGILAGDHCKAASDLNLPLVGIGLLYRQGYFQQCIDATGHQVPRFEDLDFSRLPIHRVDGDGQPLTVAVDLPGRQVWLQVWAVHVGRVTVYLLDADVAANSAADREITHRLYDSDRRRRLEQEMLLGVGGVRALRALGIAPAAWHINEGHAAFSTLERIAELTASGLPFDAARQAVAAATVFTTHTPVPAGHDTFAPELVAGYWEDRLATLGIDRPTLLQLGHDPTHDGQHFNMTALAIRGSRQCNGVSRIHGGVAAGMAAAFWPEVPAEENPVTHVTNGVHVETFLNRDLARLFDATRLDWRDHLHETGIGALIETTEPERLWSMHLSTKQHLVAELKERLARQAERWGEGHVRLAQRSRLLDLPPEQFLLVGFARRFATYKRATLLFEDRDRLARLIESSPYPLVFVFAGKAHPSDEPGQALLREIHELSRDPRFIGHVLLVEGYDMGLARRLVAGCDVWLNTPEYPLEASGTSGQKAGLNGVLNLSIADGWWAEGHDRDGHVANGWSIPPHLESAARRRAEADDLLTVLETEVVPLFTRRDAQGLPGEWIEWQRHVIATVLPRFNASRMVSDYHETHYRPAVAAGRQMAKDDFRAARERSRFEQELATHWDKVDAHVTAAPGAVIDSGEPAIIEIETISPGLSPEALRCEAVLDTGRAQRVIAGERIGQVTEQSLGRHRVTLPADLSGEHDYRLRLVPTHETLLHPYELGRMRWL
ncbi:alpha-glucan family phosphorylase [Guyparkeria hydrothermalis]|uniref:alpha-glucan family phosphorylase n=1 Tax=Guyparkeria hydrothermalis TaxID=923 RepID=UPI00201FB6C4|nr:alpha-glucan family phosphorylase [Guyparkeria hydrothermalis]MCL7743476.1 alpha-glucan family phosphorylase [Guyparkeria hydrothermalis]